LYGFSGSVSPCRRPCAPPTAQLPFLASSRRTEQLFANYGMTLRWEYVSLISLSSHDRARTGCSGPPSRARWLPHSHACDGDPPSSRISVLVLSQCASSAWGADEDRVGVPRWHCLRGSLLPSLFLATMPGESGQCGEKNHIPPTLLLDFRVFCLHRLRAS
jgi:hypothetical protein